MKKNNATSTKIKDKKKHQEKYLLFLKYLSIFVLASVLIFGLGWLSAIDSKKIPVTIEYDFSVLPNNMSEDEISFAEQINKEVGLVVGSKNGSVYHFPWCSGAQRMKEENKVWFASKVEAEEAGYTPAKNCKGL